MRIRWAGPLVAAAIAAAAPPTSAQYHNFGTQCTVSSFVACASVELWNEVDPENGDFYLFVRMSNLQGTPGFEMLSPAALMYWEISNLTVVNLPEGQSASIRTGFYSALGVLDGNTYYCVTFRECFPWPEFGVGDWLDAAAIGGMARVMAFLPGFTPVWGCDGPPVLEPGRIDPGPATCGGTVTWRAHMGEGAGFQLTSDTQMRMIFRNSTGGAECTLGSTCLAVSAPEPGGLILLGLGMAAVFAARTRRRSGLEA